MKSAHAALQRENLSGLVVNHVREMILSGVYQAGHHLLETEIAMELGISRAPVREGIKELQKDGIITILPRKGAFVTSFSRDDVKEVFDIRLLVENDILEILLKENRLTETHLNALEEMVDGMVKTAEGTGHLQDKTLMLNQQDMAFHRYIWQLSQSKRRVQILEGLFFQLRMAMMYDTNETGDLMTTAADHYAILHHLRQGNLEEAKQSLREHIVSYKEDTF